MNVIRCIAIQNLSKNNLLKSDYKFIIIGLKKNSSSLCNFNWISDKTFKRFSDFVFKDKKQKFYFSFQILKFSAIKIQILPILHIPLYGRGRLGVPSEDQTN